MPEITVAKNPKAEKAELSPWPRFDSPFRGNLFAVNPFALMRQFTEEMDRVFGPTPRMGEASVWSPTVEVKEKEGKLLVTAELPGLKKEDVKVHIEGDALIVEGERKQETEEKREGYYRSERSYGKFYRALPLPEGAKVGQAGAQFNNGVLEVTIPLAEIKAKSQEVEIQEGPKKAA